MQKATKVKAQHARRKSRSDRVFERVVMTIILVLTIIVLVPLLNVVASAFSSASAVNAGKVLLWPVDFTLYNFNAIIHYRSVWVGYRNTIFYTFSGTILSVILTMCCAYPLSRRKFAGRRFFIKMITFTMIFSGGMIPTYILMRDIHLLNTIWAILLPGAITVHNVMVMRNFMETSIPVELEESARMDGCSYFRYFTDFILPLSRPVIAVIAMYCAVAQWNEYFRAFLYLTNNELYPLQLFLRDILLESKFDSSISVDPDAAAAIQDLAATLKYVVIVVSTLPLMCLYPLVQKHFVKGVMIGSVKG